MRKALGKITYREIRKSFGRFLAILFIVMLGSGFLTGLKITQPAMLETLNNYSQTNKFFDYEIISTLGLTDDDVQAFSEIEGVEAAEGSISADALFSLPNGTDEVIKLHSVTDKTNLLKLREGRMPESPEECVVDALYVDASAIGEYLTVSQNNPSGTLEMLEYRQYKIVGIVNSPTYINFTRGTTALGNGTVSSFIYIPKEGFSADFYTEMYIRLENTGFVYSDEYDEAIEQYRQTFETLAQERAEIRFTDITGDAKGQYNAALAQYNTGIAEYTAKKQDAVNQINQGEAELKQAETQLAQSRQQLDDGWRQLNEGQAQLDEKKAEFEAQKAQVQPQLDSAKAQLDDGWAQYYAELADYNANVEKYGYTLTLMQKATVDTMKSRLDSAQAEYDSGVAQLNDAQRQLDEAQAVININRMELENAEQQYNDGVTKVEVGKAELEQSKTTAYKEFTEAEKQFEAGRLQLADANAQLSQVPEPTVYVLDRYTNTGYTCFENDSGIVDGVAKVFPIFFFMVAALVCTTTMNRMIDEQRTQIGTLKSLGYTKKEIMKGYLLYTGIASGIGSVIGIALGSVIFPKAIWMGYNIMYAFTDISLVCKWDLYAIVFAAFMFCSLAVTWLSCNNELKEVPAELVRPRTPKAGKRILLERIPFIWKRFSFLQKVSARNIFRYKKRMFMMIIGISGCTALLLTAFGVNDSITGLGDYHFENIALYDVAVSFKSSMSEEDQNGFLEKCGDEIEDCAFISMYSVEADIGDATKSVYLVGTDETDMSPFMKFARNGVEFSYPKDGEVLISDRIADQMGAKIGDTIELQNSNMQTISLKVSGIFYNVMYNYAFVTMETLRNTEGFDSSVNAAFVTIPEGSDIYESSAIISNTGYTMAVNLSSEIQDLVSRSLQSMNYIVGLIIACAGALAFIVLYNLTNINIGERIREIATIKVLGFREFETASYVYRENMVLTLMGTVVGIPLGIWLLTFVMSNIKIDMVSYIVRLTWVSYAYAIILTIVFAIIVDFVMYFRLNKINMAESLKSVE